MRLTQGTFSFLPDLTDDQIERQIDYCLSKGWAMRSRSVRGGMPGINFRTIAKMEQWSYWLLSTWPTGA